MKLYVYIVSASKNPDNVLDQELYVMGLNGSNNKGIRKILWLGKITKLLTFEMAYHSFVKNTAFKTMVKAPYSPLHVEPLYDQNNKFKGYKLISKLHKEDNEWIKDIAMSNFKGIQYDSKSFKLKDGFSRTILDKDCCFVCENIFFAEGKGLEIDGKLLQLFKDAQPGEDVDEYGIFGRDVNNNAKGRRGSFLEITDSNIITKFVSFISSKSREIPNPIPYLTTSKKYSKRSCDVIDERVIRDEKC